MYLRENKVFPKWQYIRHGEVQKYAVSVITCFCTEIIIILLYCHCVSNNQMRKSTCGQENSCWTRLNQILWLRESHAFVEPCLQTQNIQYNVWLSVFFLLLNTTYCTQHFIWCYFSYFLVFLNVTDVFLLICEVIWIASEFESDSQQDKTIFGVACNSACQISIGWFYNVRHLF